MEGGKKITATFEGEAYVAPPRTIDDILQIYTEVKLEPTLIAPNFCAERDARVPCARKLGTGYSRGTEKKLLELKSLLTQGSGDAPITVPRYLRHRGWAKNIKYAYDVYRKIANRQQFLGNIPGAIRYMNLALDSQPDEYPAYYQALLVKAYVLGGNLKAAEDTLSSALYPLSNLENIGVYTRLEILSAKAAAANRRFEPGELPYPACPRSMADILD